MTRKRLSNEEFANHVDRLYRCTDGKFPDLKDIANRFRNYEGSFNIYGMFKLGIAHRFLGKEVVTTLEEAFSYRETEKKEKEDEDPDSCLFRAS